MKSILPILTVVAAIVVAWYIAAVPMNAQWARDQAARADVTLTTKELIADTWSQERPRLPAPHQVVAELWGSTGALALDGRAFSKKSLILHAWYTLSATMLGFVIGTAAGALLAVGIVYNRAMDMAVMPWAIASQTIPILAIAPMIIVVLNSLGIQGIIPKAIISAYLSFFPVVVGMVKGLRAPGRDQLDLLSTYSATRPDTFWKLRLPASMPYFFTAMKISIAAALVGTIVGELPTGAVRGLGARMLSGSYYGQTIQIWSALVMSAMLGLVLTAAMAGLEHLVLRRRRQA